MLMNSQHMTGRRLPAFTAAVMSVILTSVAVLGLSASPAMADPANDAAVGLSWDGSAYGATTTVSYFGTPVSVPGDSATRTLQVRNDGPTAGYLTAKIVNVDLRTPEAVDTHHNSQHTAPDSSGLYGDAGDQGNIYDDIRVNWSAGSASLSELNTSVTTQLMRVPIERGAVVPVTLVYEFPVASTSGNQANVDLREASFEVELKIEGDSKPTPELPETGSSAGQTVWISAAVLLVLGTIILLSRRKRRDREETSV